MSKIVRYEFTGNWLLFWLLAISGIATPLAVLYFFSNFLRLDTEMADPERFLMEFKAGKYR